MSDIVTTSVNAMSKFRLDIDASVKKAADDLLVAMTNVYNANVNTLIQRAKLDVQNLLYQYGYRRTVSGITITIGKLSNADNNLMLPSTQFTGLASVQKVVGTSIVAYVCTLPQALDFDYNPQLQILSNTTGYSTLDNDLSTVVKVISRS